MTEGMTSASVKSRHRARPFASPFAAQVWHDLRRFGWVLPVGTVALLALGTFVVYTAVKPSHAGAISITYHLNRVFSFEPTPEHQAAGYRFLLGLVAAGALWLAAMAQALATGVWRRRDPRGGAYAEWRPLPAAEFARARVTAHALALVGTLVIVGAYYYGFVERPFTVSVLPDAAARGLVTFPEAVWALLARLMLVGGIAWLLLAPRFVAVAVGGLAVLSVATLSLAGLGAIDYASLDDITVWALVGGSAAAMLVAGGHALAKRLVPPRTAVFWSVLWLLAAGVVFLRIAPGLARSNGAAAWAPHAVYALLWTAFLPLPYLDALYALHARRHDTVRCQDPSQHARGFSARGAIALGLVILGALWLAWPRDPGYASVWHEHGWPATVQEVNAAYLDVPAGANALPDYLALAEQREQLYEGFMEQDAARQGVHVADAQYITWERLPFQGLYELERARPVPPAVWDTMSRYHALVTDAIVPALQAAPRGPYRPSQEVFREVFDLAGQRSTEFARAVRDLTRELRMAAAHAAIAGNPKAAVDAIAAMPALSDAFARGPSLFEYSSSSVPLFTAIVSAETLLNRGVVDADTLARLQRVLATSLPRGDGGYHAAMSNAAVELLDETARAGEHWWSWREANERTGIRAIPVSLLLPPEAERAALASHYYTILTTPVARAPEGVVLDERLESLGRRFGSMAIVASTVSMPSMFESRLGVRTWLDIAITAIAVERYRLANGSLPESLDDLVPAYLDAVPDDPFAPEPRPLSYRVRPGGEWVVYSYYRDMEDDSGVEMDNWHSDGDLTFTVAPLAVRTGPHVREPERGREEL